MAWKIIQSLQYQYDFHHRASVLKALNLFAQILDPINRFCIPQCTIALSDQLALFVLNSYFFSETSNGIWKTGDTCKWTNLHVTLYSYFVLPKESTRRKRLERGDHATLFKLEKNILLGKKIKVRSTEVSWHFSYNSSCWVSWFYESNWRT